MAIEHVDDLRGMLDTEIMAEIERLTRERDDARRWAVRLEQETFSERDAGYRLLEEALSGRPLFSKGAMSE